MATARDAVLDADESGLQYGCMVQSTNGFPVFREDLVYCLGQISPDVLEPILRFCRTMGNSAVEAMEGLFENTLLSDGETSYVRRGGILTGLPVEDPDDPRLAFLRQCSAERRYLSTAVHEAMPAGEFEEAEEAEAAAEPQPSMIEHAADWTSRALKGFVWLLPKAAAGPRFITIPTKAETRKKDAPQNLGLELKPMTKLACDFGGQPIEFLRGGDDCVYLRLPGGQEFASVEIEGQPYPLVRAPGLEPPAWKLGNIHWFLDLIEDDKRLAMTFIAANQA
jgi:hypothetical protein